MRKNRISETIGNIHPNYVDEAAAYTSADGSVHCSGWKKWSATAACFALVAVLGIGVFQSVLFGGERVAILPGGEQICFRRLVFPSEQLDLAFRVETRALIEDEIGALFHELPVVAYAVFNAEDESLAGIEGTVGGIKMIVSVPGAMLRDTVIEGKEEASEVDGISVCAGYWINGANILYYAVFELGESTVYLEHSGTKEQSETVKNEIAAAIRDLIELGEMDLTQVVE